MRARLFLQIASVEARRRMSYRVDFWITSALGFLVEFGALYFLWRAMFLSAPQMGGWTFEAVILYQVAVVLLGKLVRGPEFEGVISQDIYEGGLNRYLVYPLGYLRFKYAQHVGSLLPAALQLVLFGGWFLLFLDPPEGSGVTPGSLAMALGAVAAGNLLHFLMSFPLQAVAFWADNVWSLTVAMRLVTALLGGVMVPLALFPGWARDLLAWTPFPSLFALPAETLLGRVGAAEWARGLLVGLAWCAAFAAAGRAVWRRGDLQYSGVGI
ncbi:MAG: ABC transporter permease [Planctomycetaceae bacterium]